MLSRLLIAVLWSPVVCGVYCDLVTFPFRILWQMWYLIVSFPDPAVFLTAYTLWGTTINYVYIINYLLYIMCDQSKKEGKDQQSIQSSTTPDTGYQWESDNVKIRHHKREPRGQPFPSRWPQGINKQTRMKA